MKNIQPDFAITTAEQMSFIGTFLGGISVTILVTIVVFSSSKKSINWIIATSAFAASSFLISVIASMRLILALHPEVYIATSPEKLFLLWKSMIGAYAVGVVSLILSIGLSGWLRSHRSGLVTTLIASMAMFFFIYSSVFSGMN